MSAVRVLCSPHRIKASHRRRWKGAAGRFVQRYYDPIIGRFLSVDPVLADPSSGADFNRYWYANNNPYRFTDPDGRCAEDACVGEGIAACIAYAPCAAAVIAAGAFVAKKTADGLTAIIQYAKGKETHDTPSSGEGGRRKNRLPDKGEPGTVAENEPGTTKKKYGEDGWVEKEWNKGHGPNAPQNEQDDHVHDHDPNPYHPDGKPTRQPGRAPTPKDEKDFSPKASSGGSSPNANTGTDTTINTGSHIPGVETSATF